MYEIKEEGFEYNGFKLGQMTNCGKIIGFDIREGISDFIAINNNIDEHKRTIMDSNYVDIILNGYENSCFSWHVEGVIILKNENKTNEIIPTIFQSLMPAVTFPSHYLIASARTLILPMPHHKLRIEANTPLCC